LIIPLFFFFIM